MAETVGAVRLPASHPLGSRARVLLSSVFWRAVVDGLNEVPDVHCPRSQGAIYAWPNVTELCRAAGAEDSEVLRRRLLDEAGVALLSDVHFGPRIPGEGEHLRLSFAASTADLREGIRRIDAFAKAARLGEVGRSASPAVR